MAREEIEKKVTKIISEIADVSEDKIQPTSSFTNELHVDSLMFYEITQEIEDVFQFEIDEEDLESIKTVKDAVDYIEQALQKK